MSASVRPIGAAARAPAAPGRERFFDCAFVGSPRELAPSHATTGPWMAFRDRGSDPAFPGVLRALRGEAGFRGGTDDPAAARAFDGEVFVEGPVWARSFEALAAPRRAEMRVVLHFESDPSGWWDFARACGGGLAAIFRAGGLPAGCAAALDPFLETWGGARVSGGRIAPAIGYYARDFRKLIEAGGRGIARVMAALADEESRAAYARILWGSAEQVVSAFAARAFGPQQYMDVVRIAPGDVIVNCGIGNGWELAYFLSRLRGEGRIHNFDVNMCYQGTVYGDFIGLFSDMISDHRLLLSDRDGELALPATDASMVRSGAAARALEGQGGEGLARHPCRRLDSLMGEGLADRVDLIKMDLEGGEIFALDGAMETIRTRRPRLAVAIYHEPEHLWAYPLRLIDALEDYRFYIRQYGYSRFETLLYAVPMEDSASGSGEERLPQETPRARRSGAAPGRAGELLHLYFRDRAGAERRLYSGPARALTRFYGAAWETAELRPMPRVEADEVVGVVERGEDAVIVTRHAYGPDRVQLVIGERTGDTGVAWRAAAPVSPEARCALVDSDDGAARVLVWEPACRSARLCRYAGGAIAVERDVSLDAAPLAAALGPGGALAVDCLSPDGRGLARRSVSRFGARGGGAAVPLGGAAVGTALLVSRAGGAVRRRRAVLVQTDDPGALTVAAREGDGPFAPVRTIRWDPRFEPVGVVVAAG